jgi:ubiquinone/menaquinone biosynthesis C-methylase UbiE
MYIKPGSTVVDIGSGSGAYVYEVCRVNGPNGKVIAIDIDESKLQLIKDTAKIGGYIVDTLICDIEKGIMLPDYSADYIIFGNTLHQIEKQSRSIVLNEISRILSPRGFMLFVDWSHESKLGPAKDLIVSKADAIEMLSSVGLKVKSDLEAGDYHYGLLLEK